MKRLFPLAGHLLAVAILVLALFTPAVASVPVLVPSDGIPTADPMPPTSAPSAAQMIAIFNQAARESGPGIGPVSDFRREVIVPGIAHYSAKVRIGSGPYDVIGIHRIVKERRPFEPARTRDGIMLLHGDGWGFSGAFLASLGMPSVPPDEVFPVYLAMQDLDVWGIDQGWTMVPAEETDLAWAADWGFEKELRGLDSAISIARSIRNITGSGAGKIFLLGWSRGAQVVLVHANQETHLAPGLRGVKGYIYADVYLKFTEENMKQAACDYYDWEMEMIAAGEYCDTAPGLFAYLGMLAATAPDEPSPLFDGFTNIQAALYLGAVPFGIAYAPNYHLVAGTFDETGMPVGLQYTTVGRFINWMSGAANLEPWRIEADGDAIGCERSDVPWDDHFAEITAPILYIEAAGGAGGDTGRQTLSFLPRADVTELIIQLHPENERPLDFGHVDLWYADNAPVMLWRPILDWLKKH